MGMGREQADETLPQARPASRGSREEMSPPNKDTWPGLQYLSLKSFEFDVSVLTSHDIQGQVTVVEEGSKCQVFAPRLMSRLWEIKT